MAKTTNVNNAGAAAAAVRHADLVLNALLIAAVAAVAVALAYHPYFFGDELILHRLAIQHDYAFWPIFRDVNAYKPRLVNNAIATLLAQWQLQRWVPAALQVICEVWIGTLLYGVVRYLLGGDRLLAWLLIASVVISRYGMVFYFDYSSGVLDLLGTALLLTALVTAWLAWRADFRPWHATAALIASVLCIFVHERYVAGLLTAGVVIAIAECVGPASRRRLPVLAWALSLGLLPLVLFWSAKVVFRSLPMATGTAGQQVTLGSDTFGAALAYAYNVFLGGNYGHVWYWGTYNYQQSVGQILAFCSAVITIGLAALIVLRKGVAWRNRWLAVSLAGVALAMIAVASLPGSSFLQPRWMFPVGILVALAWLVILDGRWRHAMLGVIVATHLAYLVLGSHYSMAQVSASRSTSVLAASMRDLMPSGGSAIVVGGPADKWAIGGGDAVDMGPRVGDTFSRVNFRNGALHVDPYVMGRPIDPARYDQGFVFDSITPSNVARYRMVSVNEALTMALASTSDQGRVAVKFDAHAPGVQTVSLIEYYNRALDHYFMTRDPEEIAALDSGVKVRGWLRTGQSFPVYTTAAVGTSPVCRFKLPPEVGDSYFFGRGPIECGTTGRDNPTYINEGVVFHVVLPAAGTCPDGTREVYRVFDNRPDINHRYIVDRAIRSLMVASGWVIEGDGPNAVVMCAPLAAS